MGMRCPCSRVLSTFAVKSGSSGSGPILPVAIAMSVYKPHVTELTGVAEVDPGNIIKVDRRPYKTVALRATFATANLSFSDV